MCSMAAKLALFLFLSVAAFGQFTPPSGGGPSGPAGGALAGTYPNPTIAGVGSTANAVVMTDGSANLLAATSSATIPGLRVSGALTNNGSYAGSAIMPTANGGTGASSLAVAGIAQLGYANVGNLAVSGSLTSGNGGSTNGLVEVQVTALGVTPAFGVYTVNNTPASSGSQQIGAALGDCGQGWATTPSASQLVCDMDYVLPVQGSANPTGTRYFGFQINGGTPTFPMSLTSAGVFSSTQVGPANGSSTYPSLCFLSDCVFQGTGWYRNASNQWTWSIGTVNQISLVYQLLRLNSAEDFCWGSGDSQSSCAAGISMPSAGVLSFDTTTTGNSSATIKATTMTLSGSSFGFAGKTCTIVSTAISCS
jgi:hypothetical protein